MELRIISAEIIKPSSPTPLHLRTHKLSLLDQLAPDIYYPVILFYPAVDDNDIKISGDRLKKSLSETLSHYYPFAGRVKDDYFVDCGDYGVTFMEAHVASKVSEILKQPEIDKLEQLLPFNPNENVSTEVNLAVQLNYFDCGGLAICVCFRHVIADVTAATGFVKNWAAISRGCGDIKNLIFDCTSIFPPQDSITSLSRSINEKQHSTECITKRFAFDGTKIAALREKIDNGSYLNRPTRFEVVSVLIWGALIDMAKKGGNPPPLAVIPVNLRKRMNPPLPQQCIGNIFHSITVNWFPNEAADYNSLTTNIHEFIKTVNNDYIRKVYDGGAFANHFRKAAEQFVSNAGKVRLFGFSGWGGLPYYETDFGWGKPTWVSTAMRLNNVAVLLDSCDGKGIEAWVGLPENEMAKFEQDSGILPYASFNPSAKFKQNLAW